MTDVEPRHVAFQHLDGPQIHLQGDHVRMPGVQGPGERAGARTDLNHRITGMRFQTRDDLPDKVPIHQEMLAEGLLRDNAHIREAISISMSR
jgi:hypothetical protein